VPTLPLPTLVERFGALDVLVVGDPILDAYVDGPAARLAREAPVPVVVVAEREEAPGGAANTAVNVAALGGRARLLTAVGADAVGDRLLAGLEAAGLATDAAIRVPGRATLHKQRILAGGEMLARVDEGSLAPLAGRAPAASARARAATNVSPAPVVDRTTSAVRPEWRGRRPRSMSTQPSWSIVAAASAAPERSSSRSPSPARNVARAPSTSRARTPSSASASS
jgi:hypothetical protein